MGMMPFPITNDTPVVARVFVICVIWQWCLDGDTKMYMNVVLNFLMHDLPQLGPQMNILLEKDIYCRLMNTNCGGLYSIPVE